MRLKLQCGHDRCQTCVYRYDTCLLCNAKGKSTNSFIQIFILTWMKLWCFRRQLSVCWKTQFVFTKNWLKVVTNLIKISCCFGHLKLVLGANFSFIAFLEKDFSLSQEICFVHLIAISSSLRVLLLSENSMATMVNWQKHVALRYRQPVGSNCRKLLTSSWYKNTVRWLLVVQKWCD